MFCFCELKRQNFNCEVCTECLANPLEINAIQQLSVYNQCVNCDKFLCSFHLDHKFIDVDLCPQCYYTQNSNYSFYDPEDDFDDGTNFTETQIYRNYDSRQLSYARDLEDEDEDENDEINGQGESDEDDDYNRGVDDDEDEDEDDVNERYNVTFFNQMHRYYEGQQQRESADEDMDLSGYPDHDENGNEHQTTSESGGSDTATNFNKSDNVPINPTHMTNDEITELYNEKRACPICLEVLADDSFAETRLELGLGLLAVPTICVRLPCNQNTLTTAETAPSTRVQSTVKMPENATAVLVSQGNRSDDRFIVSQQRAFSSSISVQMTSVVDAPPERKLLLTRLRCHKTHIFHSKCIDQWLKNKNACPLCCRRVGGIIK